MGTRTSAVRFVTVCAAALLPSLTLARAEEPSSQPVPEQQTRQLWDDAFANSRPPAAKPARRPRPAPAPTANDAFVGVTVWKLEPAAATEASRAVAISSAPNESWLAHRVELGAGFPEGQRVRLSFEASCRGFLYVIDREKYADGSFGEPYLIFPTLRTRQGNNEVQAGRVVEIPDLTDHPPFFTMKRARRDQVGEVLTVLITPTPLAGLAIGRSPLHLSGEQVREWETRWSTPTRQLELKGGAGRPYTRVEKEAAESESRLLTQEDPLPQTMFRVSSKPGDPLLVAVPLAVTKASAPR
ncbi:MAG TPA: hypothetical protein VMX54_08265 [Vicinamibacteria bacterium]|nr:hypothetical protein [Vicinamibacteria bacterium]